MAGRIGIGPSVVNEVSLAVVKEPGRPELRRVIQIPECPLAEDTRGLFRWGVEEL